MKKSDYTNIRIDRHKIVSILLLVLIEKDFLKATSSETHLERYTNIFLGYLLAKTIIKDFYDKDEKNKDKLVPKLDISNDNYMDDFRKLIINHLDFLKLSYQEKNKQSILSHLQITKIIYNLSFI